MEIPFKELPVDTLTAIIEEFITREGTDYGDHDYSLAQKVEQVKQQLHRGEVVVSYDPEFQSCQLLPREKFRASLDSGASDADSSEDAPTEFD